MITFELCYLLQIVDSETGPLLSVCVSIPPLVRQCDRRNPSFIVSLPAKSASLPCILLVYKQARKGVMVVEHCNCMLSSSFAEYVCHYIQPVDIWQISGLVATWAVWWTTLLTSPAVTRKVRTRSCRCVSNDRREGQFHTLHKA